MYSLLNKTKICRVCKKSFANGRALGGHMRSHTQKLSLRCNKSKSASSSTIPSLKTSNKLEANLINSHETVLMRSVHTNEVLVGPKPDLHREGGEETTGKRKFVIDLNKVCRIEPPSCLTDEECAALCLIDISKHKPSENGQKPKESDLSVPTRKGKETVEYINIDSEDEDEDVKFPTSDVGILTEDKHEDDEDDDEDAYLVAKEKKSRKKYKCDTCGKFLRSYQALGGHRTSHRNKRLKIFDKKDHQAVTSENVVVVRRQFECQICGRMFNSGQALGGHKKVHYMYLQVQPNK